MVLWLRLLGGVVLIVLGWLIFGHHLPIADSLSEGVTLVLSLGLVLLGLITSFASIRGDRV